MYRIRFHGRGGHGMKTASRILGTAFFGEGFEVQDAPRYGAERRGAPIFAYVRADRDSIHERGVISRPDLVVVADDTLISVPAAGIMDGVDAHSVLLIIGNENADTWRNRLKTPARIVTLAPIGGEEAAERAHIGAVCAAAAARLVGVVSETAFKTALQQELAGLGEAAVADNWRRAKQAFDALAKTEGIVATAAAPDGGEASPPDWIDLPLDSADLSAPAIHATATSVQVRTGLWRTMRPVLDKELCHKCTWICGSFCPDGVISNDPEDYPLVDLEHCKGCLVCVVQCPTHAFEAVPENAVAAARGDAA